MNGFQTELKRIKRKMLIEKERSSFQFLCVFTIFAFVALFMTIVNLITDRSLLMIATLAFSILNLLNFLLARFVPKTVPLTRVLFILEIFTLFAVFIITGEPEGFSAIWSALFPMGVLILYRKKTGAILSGSFFLMLVFFFWIPFGKSLLQYEYTKSFLLRFPFLYIAFFCVGFFFEYVRSYTQDELHKSNERYRVLSYTDTLTGLGNETFYFKTLEKLEKNLGKKCQPFAIAVMDVNNVKATNDKHGHRYGCHLIVTAGKTLPSIFRTSKLFHIGGDEFVAIILGDDYDHLEERISKFCKTLAYAKTSFEKTELILSVAIGYSVYHEGDTYVDVFQRADEQMYKIKAAMKQKYHIASR